jgi:hypothetical protein
VFKYLNGDVYTGEFDDDSLTGTGKMQYKRSREVYKGQFVNDKRNGQGTLWDKTGLVIYSGFWR